MGTDSPHPLQAPTTECQGAAQASQGGASPGLGVYLPQGYDKVAGIFLFAGKADVVARDEHLARDVQLVEWCPQGAACVAIQALIPREPECGPVALILGSGVQVSGEATVGVGGQGQVLYFHTGSRIFGVLS